MANNFTAATGLAGGTLVVNAAPVTPVASDFTIGNLNQIAGSVTAVTITPNAGKSQGAITIYYNGSTAIPQTPNNYTVTFDVAADMANNFTAATGLEGGTLVVNPATVPVTGVVLNIHSQELQIGDQLFLTATVQPENATNQNVMWESSNLSVASLENSTVTALAEGTATIRVTSLDNPAIYDECVVTVSDNTGIDNHASDSGISIYPNPVKEELKIKSEKLKIKNVEIVNLSGKVLNSQSFTGKSVNVSALPQGVYFVKLETDNGIVIQKFIKE